eukprot:6007869-Prymnesium_polylepis.1
MHSADAHQPWASSTQPPMRRPSIYSPPKPPVAPPFHPAAHRAALTSCSGAPSIATITSPSTSVSTVA